METLQGASGDVLRAAARDLSTAVQEAREKAIREVSTVLADATRALESLQGGGFGELSPNWFTSAAGSLDVLRELARQARYFDIRADIADERAGR